LLKRPSRRSNAVRNNQQAATGNHSFFLGLADVARPGRSTNRRELLTAIRVADFGSFEAFRPVFKRRPGAWALRLGLGCG